MVRIPLLPTAPAAEVEAVGIAAEEAAVMGIALAVVGAGPTGASQKSIS